MYVDNLNGTFWIKLLERDLLQDWDMPLLSTAIPFLYSEVTHLTKEFQMNSLC